MWTALLVSLTLGQTAGKDTEIKKDKNDIKDIKVIARSVWPVMEEKPMQCVLHSSEELAIALGVDPQNAREKRFLKDAVFDTARLLKIKDIDWDKQMLIVIAAKRTKEMAGHRVAIQSVRVKDGTLIVSWKLEKPASGAGTAFPGQMALVERFRGTVRFEPPLEKK